MKFKVMDEVIYSIALNSKNELDAILDSLLEELDGEEGQIIEVYNRNKDYPYEIMWYNTELGSRLNDEGYHLFADNELALKPKREEVTA